MEYLTTTELKFTWHILALFSIVVQVYGFFFAKLQQFSAIA